MSCRGQRLCPKPSRVFCASARPREPTFPRSGFEHGSTSAVIFWFHDDPLSGFRRFPGRTPYSAFRRCRWIHDGVHSAGRRKRSFTEFGETVKFLLSIGSADAVDHPVGRERRLPDTIAIKRKATSENSN